MTDLSLATFTMRTNCDLHRIAVLRIHGEELHSCLTCRATLLVKTGQPAPCPVRRLLDWQLSRDITGVPPDAGSSSTRAPGSFPPGDAVSNPSPAPVAEVER